MLKLLTKKQQQTAGQISIFYLVNVMLCCFFPCSVSMLPHVWMFVFGSKIMSCKILFAPPFCVCLARSDDAAAAVCLFHLLFCARLSLVQALRLVRSPPFGVVLRKQASLRGKTNLTAQVVEIWMAFAQSSVRLAAAFLKKTPLYVRFVVEPPKASE